MVPYYTVLIFAVIGAIMNGISGFFIWGFISCLSVIAFGWILGKINGGVVPRKVRNETASDFLVSYSDLIKATYPNMSPFQAKDLIAAMLDDIAKRALRNDPSLRATVNPHIFYTTALQIVEEQPTTPEKELVRTFVEFLRTHKYWKIKY